MLVTQASSNYIYYFGAIVIISMLERVVTIISIVSLCLLVGMINLTNPTGVGPFGILVFFALSYMSLLGLVAHFIFISKKLLVHLSSAFTVKRPLTNMSFKKSVYYASVISASPIILGGLQTVGSVGLYEVGLALLFVIVGCFYIARRTN